MTLTYNPNSSIHDVIKSLGHEMSIVEDIKDLTEDQKILVEYFGGKTLGKRFARRSDLNPMEMAKYIPNVILFDLVYDQNGNIDDVTFRLLGTAVASFYGDWTGKSIKNEAFQKNFPESNIRLLKEIDLILESKKSVTTESKKYSKTLPYVNIHTLKIPFSKNGTDIDMIFMYFEKAVDI